MKGRMVVLAIASMLVFSSMVFAQANIGFMGVGGRIGFIMPEGDIDNTLGFGANADLGTIMPNLKLFGYLDFWTKGYDVSQYWDWSWTSIGISGIVKYEFAMEGNLKPYAGGGLGFNITSWSWDYSGPSSPFYDQVDDSDSEMDVALHFLGGASMPLSPTLDGFGELRYTIDGADYFGIYVGVSYKLKQ